MSKEKAIDDFCKLPTTYNKIVVGDGPDRTRLESSYPEVTFVGFKTGVDLAKFYQAADVFVFPSRFDTFGIVMIESMACGTPVAAYPVEGPIDVVVNGVTGFLNNDLETAVEQCLLLDRDSVYENSKHFTWKRTWKLFKRFINKSASSVDRNRMYSYK